MSEGRAPQRIVVVGGGIAGLSCAWFLARDGHAVTLVEREPRHDAHSTGRSAEILRTAVDDPVTREIAGASAAMLVEPERAGLEGERSFVDGRGLVLAFDGEPAWLADALGTLGGVEQDRADHASACGHFRPRGDRCVAFPAAGRIDGTRLVRTLARAAQGRGATFLRSRGVAELAVESGRARGVVLEGGERLEADAVVLAAGAWSRPLGAAVGAPLGVRPTRRHLFRFPPDALRTGPAAPPVVWDDAADVYVAREASGAWLLSTCDVEAVQDVDAPGRYETDPAEVERARDAFERHLGARWTGPLEAWTGFRDLSPDDRPVLGPDGRVAGLHWCAGVGGHGFTLSLGAGRAFAEALRDPAGDLAARCARARLDAADRPAAAPGRRSLHGRA